MTDKPAIVTVFYDGSCPLCSAEIDVYRHHAGVGKVAFVDVSAYGAGPVVSGLDKTIALKRFHVRTADGTLGSGAEAFGHLWLAIPAWRWLGRFVLLPGVLQAAETIYRWFLVVRPALQWICRDKSSGGTRL